MEDLERNLNQVPFEEDEADVCRRTQMGFWLVHFGAVQTWVPARATLYASNHLSRLQSDSAKIKRLRTLTKSKQCRFQAESMRMITAFSQHNCGGSDAGTAAIIAATLWVMHYKMGMSLTSEALGHVTPSKSLIIEWEHQYAAELFITR